MRVYFHDCIIGQTPLGVFTNIFNAQDRRACRGWYLTVHVWHYRLALIGKGQ